MNLVVVATKLMKPCTAALVQTMRLDQFKLILTLGVSWR